MLAGMVTAQVKKPTLMVVPSDAFCKQAGYMQKFDNIGTIMEVPDYTAALQGDPDLLLVIGKINTMMAERGFPLKNLESELKSIKQEAAESSVMMSKQGSMISESPIDVLKRTAQADIIIQLTYTVNEVGPKKTISFNLQGLDSYTNKQIAGAQGTGNPSFSADVPTLLEEAVLANMDNFSNTLQTYFEDMFEKGREITFQVKVWDGSPVDLEEAYDYNGENEELNIFIDDWVAENTVKQRYNLSTVTANQMKFEQVRIPLTYERNGRERGMDSRVFANNLRKFLAQEPFNLECKVYQKGLGEAWVIIGEK
ncbi:hypothetical protein KFE98_03955 [bacterium SCSIO 12741]|nr:hypothetical protein KFE98_03955 [bacterium SCSIO 12741]